MHTDEHGFVFRQRVPGPPLSDFVTNFWHFTGYSADHDRERVLPDGCCTLIINLQDTPRRRFDQAHPERSVAYRRAWISGVQTEYLVIDVLANSSLMGVHFKSGGLAPFIPGGAAEVSRQVVEADEVWGVAALDLHDALRNLSTAEARFNLLEEFLLRIARNRFQRHPAIRHALRCFNVAPQQASIAAVAGEIGLSHKQFIEHFRREVGMTPRRYCRIRRFQLVLDELERRPVLSWPELALACGYYDQAHFINEFRDFSGLNPQSYLRDAGEYRNFVPVRA